MHSIRVSLLKHDELKKKKYVPTWKASGSFDPTGPHRRLPTVSFLISTNMENILCLAATFLARLLLFNVCVLNLTRVFN